MSRSNSRGGGRACQSRNAAKDTWSQRRKLFEDGDVTDPINEQNDDEKSHHNHQSWATCNTGFGSRRPCGHRGRDRGKFPGIFHRENPHQIGCSRNSSTLSAESSGELNTTEGQGNEETSLNSEASSTIKLSKLLYRDDNEVLFKLQTPSFGFVQRLQQGSTGQMMTELLIKVIAKSCTSVHQSQLIGLLSKVQNSNFLKNDLLLYLNSFVQEDAMVKPNICKALIGILRTLAKLFPSKSLTVITLLCAPLQRILTIETYEYNDANNDYQKLLEETTDIRKQLQSGIVQRDQERQVEWTVDESEDYRRMSVVPTSEDIRGQGDPYLRENKIYQTYKDSRDYLDVQFRLMKEDLVRPLREGLAELLHNREEGKNRRTKSNMKVYRHVQIASVRCSQHGLIYKIQFDVSQLKHVQWQAGKRLMLGGLVCLSADDFKNMLIATVAERDAIDLSHGVTYLYFDNDSSRNKDIKLDQIYEMIESPAFYEPYKCVLKALQKFTDEEKLPFERYLLNKIGGENVPPPKYLTKDVKYNFSSLMHKTKGTRLRLAAWRNVDRFQFANLRECTKGTVTVLDLSTWPTAEELSLDASQYSALQTAITKEFAVIQGPPGTGKTFIGVKLVQLLLENNERERPLWNSPIMLVCFTNHALDQFLEDIIRVYPEDVGKGMFVRVGGSSKSENEELKKCFLKHIKQSRNSEFRGATFEPRKTMAELENKIMKLSAYAEIAEKELIHPDALRPHMRHVQFNHIEHFLKWLCDKKAQPGTPNLLGVDAFVGGRQHQNDLENPRDLEEEYEDQELMETEEREQNENNLMSSEEKFQVALKSVREGNTFVKLNGKDDGNVKELYHTAQSIHRRFHEAFEESDDIITVKNQWQLNLTDRWRLYNYWTKRFMAAKRDEMQTLLNDHATEKRKLEEVQDEIDYRIFNHAKIIAMTTTGAAKRSDLLKRVAPKIVIVEEAAEVLEAHVVASLSDNCEHLILIGDHQQLKPKPADYSLAKKYRLEISLFEKMVLNKLHCNRLTIQHRMRPEIAQLLVPHIYKSLENHKSVLRYENVANVFGNLFFVNHSEHENSTDDNRSHSNDHEATFIAELCRYLLNVGYNPKQITVLTTYTGQLYLLQNLMPKSEFEDVLITPVDNFQGEENDIILLSLVRSNEQNKIGFVKISNRICVALSRAKKGLYIFGNGDQLRDESPLWRDILDTLKKQNKLVDSLPLGCHKHPENVIFVKTAADFQNVPRSGCEHPCDCRLPCGHVCVKLCHELDPEHQIYKCKKPCPKLCANNTHPCRMLCFENCGDCMELVERTLSRCGHKATMCCYLKEETFKCEQPCPKLCSNSTHPCRNLCFENCGDCMELLERTLSRCGHQATMCCYLKEETFKCEQPCKLECTAGHPCQQLCNEECKCRILVTRTLTRCQHEATIPCYLTELEYQCEEPCTKFCPFDHPCKRLCFQTCKPCTVLVTKTLSACKHEAEMLCCLPEQTFKCKELCSKSCSGNHPCQNLCYESCGNCKVPVTKMLSICKHEAIMPCYMKERQYLLNNQCTVEVEKTLPLCRHVVKRPCHLSVRRYNCLESCKKSCSTGHPCVNKCHEPCGDCGVTVEKVLPRCEHKAMMPCYQPVDSYICQIKCNRACPAGHSCPELCHEKCDDCQVPVEKVLPSCEHMAKMPCYREPSKHRCQLPCERKCPEGHRCRKKCGDDCRYCMLKVQKMLPKCKHVGMVKCHQSPSTVMCKLPCEKTLLCGHKCQEICGAVKCTTACKVNLEKELPCKHMADLECHQDPRTYVCHRQVKKMLPCDHLTSMECHQDPKDYSCHQAVEKKLPCDHLATMECSQNSNSYLCRAQIEVVVCGNGHTKEMDCCSKETKFPSCVEMVKLTCSTGLPKHVFNAECQSQETTNRAGCPNICDVELDCGHRCTKTCRNCVQQGSHSKCMFECEKHFPLCLHKCRKYCSEQCKPCLDRSSYICSHQESRKRCAEPHRLCFKPCDWNCPHYSCTSVCSGECNRPPCNHPCRKPLRCGHVCSGLCGEPCISLCRRCNKENFYELAWSPFDKDESRFLELQPCRHIVEVAAMDRCFLDTLTSLPYALDQRRFLVCPVCSEKVSFCPRYNQYIRRHESQLNAAKQLIDESKILKEIATEYICVWLKSHHLNPEQRHTLFMKRLKQRLRLGALCILQEIETLALQTKKSDFHKTFTLSLEDAIKRVKQNYFYLVDNKTMAASDTILMYKFYMEAQTHRLASFIRGPKLRDLDKCKEDLKAFESMELVEDNFLRIWEIIEKLNRRLSEKLSAKDRRDGIEDYIHHLNRFYDFEPDATFTSQWMCCTFGHVYAKKELLEENRIDAVCPYCHPLHKFLLYFLKPDRIERYAISKLDLTGYYHPSDSAPGLENRIRKENRKTDRKPERKPERSGSLRIRKTVESEMLDSNLEGRSSAESVRGRGGSRGRRGQRGRSARGSQVERNSEYLQGRNQQLVQTVREPHASVQSSADLQRSSDSPRGRGRGRGGGSMKDRFGMEQPMQTSTFGELPTAKGGAAAIANVHRGNSSGNKRGAFNDGRDSRYMQMPAERCNTQTPTFMGSRDSPSFWCDTVRTQLENMQAISSPKFQEEPKNDLADVVSSQAEDTSPRSSGNVGNGPAQNTTAKNKRGSRGRRPFLK